MKRIYSLLLIAVFILLGHKASAQAYDYEVKAIESAEGYWKAELKNTLKFSDNQGISFRIICGAGKTASLSFYTYDLDSKQALLATLIGSGKTGTVQIHLSNGEILTTSQAQAAEVFIGVGLHNLISNKRVLGSYGGDAMHLLRNYDITKFVIQGHNFVTPNFHSAVTIDAMCKSLILKVGDDGQFDSKSTQSSYTQPSPTTNVRTGMQMNIRQLIACPLGVLPESSKGMSTSNVKNALSSSGWTWNEEIHGDLTTLEFKARKGYNNSYAGVIPSTSDLIFNYSNLTHYEYHFFFDEGDHRQKAINLYNQINRDLKQAGAGIKDVSEKHKGIKCQFANRSFYVWLYTNETEYSSVFIDVSM